MDAEQSNNAARAPLVVYTCTSEIITAIAFFAAASIYESFSKKPAPPASLRLYRFQLAVTSCIIVSSIVHAATLAYPVILQSESDPLVACALFTILAWVILLLPLIDRDRDAGFPHYGAWITTWIFEILNCFFTVTNITKHDGPLCLIDGVIVVIRLVLITLLITGSVCTKCVFARKEKGTTDETRPLLDEESRTAGQDEMDKKDENEDGESDEDRGEAWEAELADLRKRPWTEYVASFKIFLPHLRPQSGDQYVCFAVMVAVTGVDRVLNVLAPMSLGWVVNGLQGSTSIPWTPVLQYLILSFISSSAGLDVVQNLASLRMSRSMRQALDVFVYDHIMNLDAKFHDSKKTATLGRVTDRGDAVIDLFQEFFFHLMPTVADLLISLAVLQWFFGAYLCFIVAMTGVLFAWSNTKLIKNRTVLRRKYIEAWCGVYELMFETQYNWTTVSHFNRVEHEKDNFREKNHSKMSKEMDLSTYTEVTRCTRQLIVTSGFICAVILAANRIARGHQSVGEFVMLVSYWSKVMAPVRSIITTITTVSERLVDAEKLLIVLEKKPTVREIPDAPELDFQGGSVDFDNVSFSYDGERTASEGISFHADAGKTVALVGETGGGKSTILKLLFRFYDPTQGRVMIDGQDLQNVKLESFRKLIGIVPQDPAMFNRTILDNVRYPDNTATEEEVVEACKAACLHDKIMTFTKQYKEMVGEKGTKLSGGEAQRLAIARAILKKPKMLLLDEATSAVDSVTENKIQACLRDLCKGRTTFVIAHRLSTILHADTIMVIKGGKLMEMGPHKQLIKQKGAYRELWDAQLNLQTQDPGDAQDDIEDKSSCQGQRSMFYNDMGKEDIDEAMLLAMDNDAEHDPVNEHRPSSSGSNKSDNNGKRRLTHRNQNGSEVSSNHEEFESGDVTEVGSGDESLDGKDKSQKH